MKWVSAEMRASEGREFIERRSSESSSLLWQNPRGKGQKKKSLFVVLIVDSTIEEHHDQKVHAHRATGHCGP